MDALPAVLHELFLYVIVVLVFLGPIEAFLRFRLWRTSRHGAGSAYLARSDPWVSAVVALSGLSAIALVRLLA